jgi:hypothetical protein
VTGELGLSKVVVDSESTRLRFIEGVLIDEELVLLVEADDAANQLAMFRTRCVAAFRLLLPLLLCAS